jgi:predicted transcriptional regulator
MNKCIILSVKPQWLHKILIGQKTIEIRKSMPKCDYPIDVYLYCTKEKPYLRIYPFNINENIYQLTDDNFNCLNGKIVAKFMLNKVDKINNCGSCFEIANESYAYTNAIGNRSCLEFNDMKKYLNNRNGYAWHIDNLEFFNEPMKLMEFKYECLKGEKNRCDGCDFYFFNQNESVGTEEECLCDCMPKLSRPPQSWRYAYKEE